MDDLSPSRTARLEQLFADQAKRTPDSPAIYFRGEVVSYGELDAQVGALALDLRHHGLAEGVIAAIYLQRTPAMVVTVLAVLRAGGAYLPIDPRSPADRVRFMLADSGAAFLVADLPCPGGEDVPCNVLELADGALVQRAYRSAPKATAPAELAYVIYTSGSTGAPKGVMLGHSAIGLVDWAGKAFSAEERSRVAATTSLCFDPSIFEIFVPLCTGGALILKQDALDPFAGDERPTMLDTVPSVLRQLCRADAIPASVRVLNVGGETLPGELVREAYRSRRDMVLYNHYGPTEATTCATVGRAPRDLAGEPSIGEPVGGAKIKIVDRWGANVAEGETGEILIGGAGLALGYLNRREATAASFADMAEGRFYRTGDLACRRDGELYFRGRTDQQVKVRGHRIELREVEAALLRVPGVERAVVTVNEAGPRAQLVAYLQRQTPLTPPAVRKALAVWLPDYMLPGRVIVRRALPTLASGKLDHTALMQLDEAPQHSDEEPSRAERPIIHVFEEILARQAVGPCDSFFDLGGDSLSSVEAALRLGEVLGHDLPAALLHQAPSARALAQFLEMQRLRPDRHISVLQPGGEGAALFCMADLFGQPFNYLSLARRLGSDRPVYGVSPGPLQEAFVRERDVARLSRSFLAEVRSLQPQGPYFIAGHSAGGMLALDLACALEEQGEVVRLILLDASLHSRRPSFGAVSKWAVGQAVQLTAKSRAPTAFSPAHLRKLAQRWVPGSPPSWIPPSQLAFAASMIKAALTYRPGRFCGPTLVVKATERDPIDQLFDQDGLMGWSASLAGRIVQTSVGGGHYTFMREPGVRETARVVSQFIQTFI